MRISANPTMRSIRLVRHNFFIPNYFIPLTLNAPQVNVRPLTPSRCGGRWPAKISSTAGGAGGVRGRSFRTVGVAASKVLLWAFPGGKGCKSGACKRTWLKPKTIMGQRIKPQTAPVRVNVRCSAFSGATLSSLPGTGKDRYARRKNRPALHRTPRSRVVV